MLYLITGASGSGKSACLGRLRELNPETFWYDFDEVGVPPNADKVWRQRTSEYWVKRAIQHQTDGRDTAICGNIILGEVLACPSASELNGVAACLLDCHDVVRIGRLRARGLDGARQEMLNWAAWQRMHAVDPQWHQDVIRHESAAEMCWERWANWHRGDPRWQVFVLDTTAMTIEEVGSAISTWLAKERAKQVAG